MFKKLALWTHFLALVPFVFISLFWHSNEINADAAPVNEAVAQTSLNLSTQPAVQAALPTPFHLISQPTQSAPPELEVAPEGSDTFQQFVEAVVDGQAGVLRGVYVDGVLALRVIQQPENEPLFVSSELGIATQFQSAAKNGATGILAHNYLSGELFFQLAFGQQVQLVYGDGKVKQYIISDIQRFQKLEPDNLKSRYIDLSTGEEQSTGQVFKRFYTGKDHITFQTCIKKGNEWSWGLLFVIATPKQ